jgi:hypothetical protein
VAVKASSAANGAPTRNVEVEGAVCIGSCAALKIGTETVSSEVSSFAFRRCDVILSRRAMVIAAFDHAAISDVDFTEIWVERLDERPGIQRPTLIDFNAPASAFRPLAGESSVSGVRVHGVTSAAPYPSVIAGRDEDHRVADVRISDVTVAGRRVSSLDELGAIVGPHADCENAFGE